MSGFAYLHYQDEHGVPEIDAGEPLMDFDHSAVDFDHLQRFTLGNRSLEEEVLNLFRTQSGLYAERMREAADDKAWREAAHTLKGSAAGIGAFRVQEEAAACEKLTGPERAARGPAALKRLECRLDEANLLIAKFLNE